MISNFLSIIFRRAVRWTTDGVDQLMCYLSGSASQVVRGLAPRLCVHLSSPVPVLFLDSACSFPCSFLLVLVFPHLPQGERAGEGYVVSQQGRSPPGNVDSQQGGRCGSVTGKLRFLAGAGERRAQLPVGGGGVFRRQVSPSWFIGQSAGEPLCYPSL